MKIKILVDAHVFDDVYQGTTTYIKGIYNALVNDDTFEITLAAKNINNLKEQFADKRFKFISLPSGSKIKRLAIDIPKIIKNNQYDYAHFQYIIPLTKKCKYINTIHDVLFLDFPNLFPFSYRFKNKYAFKYSSLRSDIICTVSNFSKNSLIRNFNIDADKIIITPNSVDKNNEEIIDINKLYNIDKYILFVSRFEPRKNHSMLLRSYLDLNLYKSYKLVFVGKRNDIETQDFDKLYADLAPEIKATIFFFENISSAELHSFYKKADLFVYPSSAEGFGIPPIEAAIAGCKVICSNSTAMADFDFFGDYLFNPNDIEDLKRHISFALCDEHYPHASIQKIIAERYDWNVIADNFASELKRNILSAQ